MKILLNIIFLTLLYFNNIFPSQVGLNLPDWTILVYVQAKNNLSKFAAKNLADMAAIGSNNNLNILVQWYQPDKKGIWRYKVNKNNIDLDTCLSSESDGNRPNDLVDSMRWAVNKYPAKNYFLILWNHGVGILDPIWGDKHSLGISSKDFEENPKISLDGITKSFVQDLEDLDNHRGILFNEINRTYMNNQDLSLALSEIKTKVLNNKKLDILGMDACLMAMLEVGYQVRNYANYLIASEEIELAHGWDYLNILNILSLNSLSPIQVAQTIIKTYEQYYKNKIQFYTQSVIDLQNLDILKNNLDNILDKINICKNFDRFTFKDILKKTREKSLQFSAKNYIDLHSFYSQLLEKLEKSFNNKNINFDFFSSIKNLKESLKLGLDLIEKSVLLSTSGSSMVQAKGLSIYYPREFVDNSYDKTDFAKESKWVNFLRENI